VFIHKTELFMGWWWDIGFEADCAGIITGGLS